jgi:hypothetical protein
LKYYSPGSARSFFEKKNYLGDGVPPLCCGSLAPCDLPERPQRKLHLPGQHTGWWVGLHFRFDKMKKMNAERLPIYSSADVDWLASVELQYFPLLARSGRRHGMHIF